jgi:hypothetical protein
LADCHVSDARSDRDDLGGDLMADREGSGEDTERRHRDVEITTRDRQWTNDGLTRAGLGVGQCLPLQQARAGEDQVLHGPALNAAGAS